MRRKKVVKGIRRMQSLLLSFVMLAQAAGTNVVLASPESVPETISFFDAGSLFPEMEYIQGDTVHLPESVNAILELPSEEVLSAPEDVVPEIVDQETVKGEVAQQEETKWTFTDASPPLAKTGTDQVYEYEQWGYTALTDTIYYVLYPQQEEAAVGIQQGLVFSEGEQQVGYRRYGAVNGGANAWYACDNEGELLGEIRQIPVTWSGANELDGGAAGEYVLGVSPEHFAGYQCLTELPSISITVKEREREEEIDAEEDAEPEPSVEPEPSAEPEKKGEQTEKKAPRSTKRVDIYWNVSTEPILDEINGMVIAQGGDDQNSGANSMLPLLTWEAVKEEAADHAYYANIILMQSIHVRPGEDTQIESVVDGRGVTFKQWSGRPGVPFFIEPGASLELSNCTIDTSASLEGGGVSVYLMDNESIVSAVPAMGTFIIGESLRFVNGMIQVDMDPGLPGKIAAPPIRLATEAPADIYRLSLLGINGDAGNSFLDWDMIHTPGSLGGYEYIDVFPLEGANVDAGWVLKQSTVDAANIRITKNSSTVYDAVYINGSSGNDLRDGSSCASAVRTFEKARNIVEAQYMVGNSIPIYICDTVSIENTQSWELPADTCGNQAVVRECTRHNPLLLAKVLPGGSLTLREVNLAYRERMGTRTREVLAVQSSDAEGVSGGIIRLEAGVIIGGAAANARNYRGILGEKAGSVTEAPAEIYMTGGELKGLVTGIEGISQGDVKVILTGGRIAECGVGIKKASVTMKSGGGHGEDGAAISNNAGSGLEQCEGTLEQGEISGNGSNGWDVYRRCTVKGGIISGNGGTGIQSYGPYTVVQIEGGEISGNSRNGIYLVNNDSPLDSPLEITGTAVIADNGYAGARSAGDVLLGGTARILRNKAGGIYAYGKVTAGQDVLIAQNEKYKIEDYRGGGINAKTVELHDNVTITENSVWGQGGGVYATSYFRADGNVEISRNTAVRDVNDGLYRESGGGGVRGGSSYLGGNVKISGNTSEGPGGGISTGSLVVEDQASIVNNEIAAVPEISHRGGGAFVSGGADITGGVIQGNTGADSGSQLWLGSGVRFTGGSIRGVEGDLSVVYGNFTRGFDPVNAILDGGIELNYLGTSEYSPSIFLTRDVPNELQNNGQWPISVGEEATGAKAGFAYIVTPYTKQEEVEKNPSENVSAFLSCFTGGALSERGILETMGRDIVLSYETDGVIVSEVYGSDSNSGATASQAVKTWERAVQKLRENIAQSESNSANTQGIEPNIYIYDYCRIPNGTEVILDYDAPELTQSKNEKKAAVQALIVTPPGVEGFVNGRFQVDGSAKFNKMDCQADIRGNRRGFELTFREGFRSSHSVYSAYGGSVKMSGNALVAGSVNLYNGGFAPSDTVDPVTVQMDGDSRIEGNLQATCMESGVYRPMGFFLEMKERSRISKSVESLSAQNIMNDKPLVYMEGNASIGEELNIVTQESSQVEHIIMGRSQSEDAPVIGAIISRKWSSGLGFVYLRTLQVLMQGKAEVAEGAAVYATELTMRDSSKIFLKNKSGTQEGVYSTRLDMERGSSIESSRVQVYEGGNIQGTVKGNLYNAYNSNTSLLITGDGLVEGTVINGGNMNIAGSAVIRNGDFKNEASGGVLIGESARLNVKSLINARDTLPFYVSGSAQIDVLERIDNEGTLRFTGTSSLNVRGSWGIYAIRNAGTMILGEYTKAECSGGELGVVQGNLEIKDNAEFRGSMGIRGGTVRLKDEAQILNGVERDFINCQGGTLYMDGSVAIEERLYLSPTFSAIQLTTEILPMNKKFYLDWDQEKLGAELVAPAGDLTDTRPYGPGGGDNFMKWGTGNSSEITEKPDNTSLWVVAPLGVYMGGAGVVPGADSNNGLSPNSPVKTFERAKQVLAQMPYGADIYIINTMEITGSQQWSFNEGGLFTNNSGDVWKPSVKRYILLESPSVITLAAGAELKIENLTMDGSAQSVTKGSTFLFNNVDNGQLTMGKDVVLQNHKGMAVYTRGGFRMEENAAVRNIERGDYYYSPTPYSAAIWIARKGSSLPAEVLSGKISAVGENSVAIGTEGNAGESITIGSLEITDVFYGVFNQSNITVHIKGANIHNNKTFLGGGGDFSTLLTSRAGTLILENTKVSNNEAVTRDVEMSMGYGGDPSLILSQSRLVLSGDTAIRENTIDLAYSEMELGYGTNSIARRASFIGMEGSGGLIIQNQAEIVGNRLSMTAAMNAKPIANGEVGAMPGAAIVFHPKGETQILDESKVVDNQVDVVYDASLGPENTTLEDDAGFLSALGVHSKQVTMSGGTIQNNLIRAPQAAGGGLALGDGGSVITGGIISGNKCISNKVSFEGTAAHGFGGGGVKLKLDSVAVGGGIYAPKGAAAIRGVSIIDNIAEQGAGIYYGRSSFASNYYRLEPNWNLGYNDYMPFAEQTSVFELASGSMQGNRAFQGEAAGEHSGIYVNGDNFRLRGNNTDIQDRIYISGKGVSATEDAAISNIILSGHPYNKNRKYQIEISDSFERGSVVVRPDESNIQDTTPYLNNFVAEKGNYTLLSAQPNLILGIYMFVDSVKGDDGNDGSNPNMAKRTWAAASEDNGGEGLAIYVSGPIRPQGRESFSLPQSSVVRRYTGFSVKGEDYPAYTGHMVELDNGDTLTIGALQMLGRKEDDGVFKGGNAMFYVGAGGELNLTEGAKLRNNANTNESGGDGRGGALYIDGGAVRIEGASLNGMMASRGKAVYQNGTLTLADRPLLDGEIYLAGSGKTDGESRKIDVEAGFAPYPGTGVIISVENPFHRRHLVSYENGYRISEEEKDYFQLALDGTAMYYMDKRENNENILELCQRKAVYVDGQNGQDEFDGLVPVRAVRTLQRAYEVLESGTGGGILFIVDTLPVTSAITLENTGSKSRYYEGTDESPQNLRVVDGEVNIRRYVRASQWQELDTLDPLLNPADYSVPSNKHELLNIEASGRFTTRRIVIDGGKEGMGGEPQYAVEGIEASEAMIVVKGGALTTVSSNLILNANVLEGGKGAGVRIENAPGDSLRATGTYRCSDTTISGMELRGAGGKGSAVYHEGAVSRQGLLLDRVVDFEGEVYLAGEATEEDSRYVSVQRNGFMGAEAGLRLTLEMETDYPGRTVVSYPTGYHPTEAQDIPVYGLSEDVVSRYIFTNRESEENILEIQVKRRVYIDGIAGDNENTGLSPVEAVRTLERAYTLLNQYGGGSLYVVGTVPILDDTMLSKTVCDSSAGTVNVESGNVEIRRYRVPDAQRLNPDYSTPGDNEGLLFEVGRGASLSLMELTINGEKNPRDSSAIYGNVGNAYEDTAAPYMSEGALIGTAPQGELYLFGGSVLQNNNNGAAALLENQQGGAIENHGTTELNGGKVQFNEAQRGDGIYQNGIFRIVSGAAGIASQEIYLTSAGDRDAVIELSEYLAREGGGFHQLTIDMDRRTVGRNVAVYGESTPQSVLMTEVEGYRILPELDNRLALGAAWNLTEEPGTLELQHNGIDVSFTKADVKDQNRTLSGVKFKVYSLACENGAHNHKTNPNDMADSTSIAAGCWTLKELSEGRQEAVSNSSGVVDFGFLQNGDYMLVESKAALGYELPSGQWQMTVEGRKSDTGSGDYRLEFEARSYSNGILPYAVVRDIDGEAGVSYKVLNSSPFSLPLSGLEGVLRYLLMGILLMAAALTTMWLRNRKKQVQV